MTETHNGNGSAAHRFSIGVDPALTAQVRKELIDTLHARAHVDPERAERELAERDVHAEFLRELGGLGLVPDNLPDLLAGNTMVMWSVVHEAPLPDRAVAAGLVRQFEAQLDGNAIVADPTKRQLMGEALLYETALTLEALRAARASADATTLKQMAETAQRNFLAQRSINLRKTRLTESGMVRI